VKATTVSLPSFSFFPHLKILCTGDLPPNYLQWQILFPSLVAPNELSSFFFPPLSAAPARPAHPSRLLPLIDFCRRAWPFPSLTRERPRWRGPRLRFIALFSFDAPPTPSIGASFPPYVLRWDSPLLLFLFIKGGKKGLGKRTTSFHRDATLHGGDFGRALFLP